MDAAFKENFRRGKPGLHIESYFPNPDSKYFVYCHWHDEWEFFFIEEGSAMQIVDGVKTLVQAGDIAFIRSGQIHSFESIDGLPWSFRVVVFNVDMLRLVTDELVESKYIRPLIEGRMEIPIVQKSEALVNTFLMLHDLSLKKLQFCELRIKASLLEMLACWLELADYDADSYKSKLTDGLSGQLKSVLNYIHEHYADPITVTELSNMMYMSAGHFTKVFYRYTSRTPIDYIITHRLFMASELLKKTDKKLNAIALDAGFYNLSYFIRSFKKFYQCTPTEYRLRS